MSLLSSPSTGRTTAYRGRIRGGPSGSGKWIKYPDPFFDIAGTYFPKDIKSLYKWCRYYALSDPILSAGIQAMAEYPVTQVVVDDSNRGVSRLWERFFEEELSLRSRLIDIGLYYMTFGTAIISLFFPFTKYLKCGICGEQEPAHNARFKYRRNRFVLHCRSCNSNSEAEAYDLPHKTTKGSRLILWDPDTITTEYNDITGDYRFFYDPPNHIVNKIKTGSDKNLISSLPQNLLESIRKNVKLELSKDNVYILRRPSVLESSKSKGMGTPLLLPALKQIFQLTLMKKAQEAVLLEKVLPFNIVFPQQSTSSVNPYEMINLKEWRNTVIDEIQKWRRDPLYMAVMPVPLGYQALGGEGRTLLMSNEIRVEYETILSGCGIPSELIFGGLSYSGSNVSLRIVENKFLVYRRGLEQFIRRFLIPRTAARMGWPKVEAHFKSFKMADDLQRKAFLFEMSNAGKISDSTLLQESDLNPKEEDDQLREETSRRLEALKSQQLAEAEIAGEVQVLQAKYHAKAQQAMAEEQMQMQQGMQESAPGEPGAGTQRQPVSPGTAPQQGPQQIAQRLQALPPQAQQATLQRIEAQNPQLAQHIRALIGGGGSGGGQSSAGAPLPEQKPPMRGPGNASI